MDLSLTTTTIAATTTLVAATAAYMMQRPKGFTEEELVADENANQNTSNTNKRAASTSPKKVDEPTVSAKKNAKKAKADKKAKKQKQKAKKAAKKAAQATITIDSSPQKAFDLTMPAENGWEVVVDKKPKAAKLSPSVAKLLSRKSLEVATVPVTSSTPVTAATTAAAANTATTATVKVAVAKIGHIVGPAGKTITAIRELTGCDVSIPDRDTITGATVDITLSGEDAREVAAARLIVADLTTKGYSAALEGTLANGDFSEAAVKVPVASLHEVIGKGGAIIQSIQSTLGVKLNVPDTTHVGAKKVVKVTVAGTREGVAKAIEVVRSLVAHHYHALTHPGTTHVEVDVPEAMYAIVIGPRGSSIKHIQNSYLVKVHIPRDGDTQQAVTVVGSVGRVKQAKKHILAMVANAYAEQEAERDWDNEGSYGYGDEPEHECHEAWMDQYRPPRRTTGAQWA